MTSFSGEHTRPSATHWNVVRSKEVIEHDETVLDEVEMQDSANLHAEFDDAGYKLKDVGAVTHFEDGYRVHPLLK